MCALDATKAFGKVNFPKLFHLLLKRNVPSVILRIVSDMYTRQSIKATWNGTNSCPINVSNGGRQGGVLSPILFNVYMDELLQRPQKQDIGCHIGTIFMGALCYADDLITLCPTRRGLQKVINDCQEFAYEHDVVFNPKKTVCMVFGYKTVPNDIDIYLGREKLRWVDSFKHLGNIVTPDLKDDLDIQLKRGTFFRSVNGLCAKFKGVLISNDVASKLFQTYCCSFYGSQLWNLSSSSFNDICTAWNKAVRRIFHLPFTTHRFLLPCVTQSDHIRDNLIKRSTTLFQNMMLSDNEVIKFLSVNAYFCNSPIGLNRKFFNMYHMYQKKALSEEEEGLRGLLLSLLKTRENHWCIPQFDIDEISEMIYHVCTL